MSPLLSVENLSYTHGDTHVIKGVHLTVSAGQFVSLLGPSGCGKTTLLRLLAGLTPPTMGTVSLRGQRASYNDKIIISPENRSMGLVFQDYALFPHMTVYDNVAFGLHRMQKSNRHRCIMDNLDIVGMADYKNRYPHELSGGQQQRVSLARAIAPSPRIILMDEPFSGLDARLRDSVREETLAILKHSKAGTIMVTHAPDEAMYMSDTIYLMHCGTMAQQGTPHDLYHHPINGFVAEFMGDVNRFEGTVCTGDKGMVVQTLLGEFPCTDNAMQEGQKCQVLFRLENMHFTCLTSPQQGKDEKKQSEGHGKIASVHHLGGISLVVITLHGGQKIRVRTHQRVTCQVGSPCFVTVTTPPHIFSL